ncbi:MAG: ComEC/Rec2 family competence protein [Clostridia bacterium]|nr:ComEC/Rec2 family competence protein [Clostridia bacterium]
MNLLQKRPLATALFVFFAGFFLLSVLPLAAKAILFGMALLLGVVPFFLKKRRPLLGASALLLSLAALLSFLSSDLPDRAIEKRRDETARYSFCALEITDAEKNVWTVGSVKDEDGRLFCRLSVDLPDGLAVKPGDKLAGEGTVVSLSAYARNGLYGKGCRGRLKLSGEVAVTGHRASFRAPFLWLASSVKETLSSRVAGENGGLLVAVLLGETDELPTGAGILFRRAGVSHALAVSGMHVVFLSAALSLLLRRLRLPRPAVGIVVVLFAFFYAALVGFTPSVLRASLMLFFYEAAWFAKRQPDSLTSLALSGAVMLLFAPYLIFSVSFLLSYLATLGILLSAQFFRAPRKKRTFLRLLPRRIASYAVMTLFAVLFTLPVSCALFGELSLLSIPSNLLLSLPIQALLYLAVAVLVLPFPFVGSFAARYCDVFLSLLRRIASVPHAALSFSSPILTAAGALPFLALLAVAFLSLSKRRRIVLCSVCGVLSLAAFLLFALPEKGNGIALLSDGSDDDLIVLRSGRRAACVDLGTPDGNLPMLRDELKAARLSEVDVYVFSSYDAGTAEGFCDMLSSVYVRRVVLTEPKNVERREYDALVSLLDRVSVDYSTVSDKCEPIGFALQFRKTEPTDGAPTVPLMISLKTANDRLLYIGENVPVDSTDDLFPDKTTAVFLGCHGETPYLSFRLDLPETVKTVFTGSEFYKTCVFDGGSPDLKTYCRKRLVPDGFLP